MMCSKSTLPLILIQMFFSSIHSKRLANHYLLRLYRDEIKILENGTFPKRDARKLEYYKQEIARNEQLVRFQAWIKMNEDSRLYDDIQTKCYKRFKTKKRRKKAANSIEKWEKRVRIHFLQNFLLQNGYFLQRRRHHTTQPTSTVLMLQFTSDKIIPNFMKKILPNGVFYKYYLPFHSLIKKVPERIHSLVKTCVDTFKRKTRQQQNTTHSSQDQNKTLHKYLRKIERSMRKLEEALGRGTSRPNTTRKKLSKGRKRLNEILKRKRRQKRFRRKLNRINLLFPPPTTHDPERDGDIRDIFETTKYVTWKRKKKTLKTTRRKRNLTRTTAGVLSKKKRRKEEKLKRKRARSNKTNPKCDKILNMRESIIKNHVKRKIIEDINYRFHKKMARKNISVPEIIVPKVILR